MEYLNVFIAHTVSCFANALVLNVSCTVELFLARFHMSLPHSGHRMSSLSVRKPLPTRDTEHFLQLKQSLCHWRSSKEMYLLPPSPICDCKHVMSTGNKDVAVLHNGSWMLDLSFLKED